jgi:hypothetical protein
VSTPKQEPASSLQALLALLPLKKRSNADVFEWLLAMEAAVAQPSEPERVPGPFVLGPDEQRALHTCHGMPGVDIELVCHALHRACHTLGPRPGASLVADDLDRYADLVACKYHGIDRMDRSYVERKACMKRALQFASGQLSTQPSEPEPEGVPPTADLEWNEDYNDAKIREPEPARDVLTAEERESVEMLRAGYGAREEIVAILDRLAPKPATISPLQALLAEMRRDDVNATRHWANKLEAALAAEKERGHG